MIIKLNRKGFCALHDRYEQSLVRIKNWGISINESSRLNKYKADLVYLSKGNIPLIQNVFVISPFQLLRQMRSRIS